MRIVEKGELHAKDSGLTDEMLLNARLMPNMFPFASQVRIATDDARRNLYLLAGKEHIKMEDNETTFTELKVRILKTQELVASLLLGVAVLGTLTVLSLVVRAYIFKTGWKLRS
jgi:hypothetical protein